MKRVCYIVSNVQKSLGFEWTAVRLKDKYELSFILLNAGDSPLEQFLKDHSIEVHRVNYEGKRTFLRSLVAVYRILSRLDPNIVHCHLLDAQLIGLTAARLAGIKKRIYTRHNSNFHHAYHPGGIKYDIWSNRLATHIVSISQATDITLTSLEKVSPDKLRKIPHGFDFNALTDVSPDRVGKIRKKYQIPGDKIIVGVIARQIEWKGIQYIIPAFRKFHASNPESLLVLANASGPYHETVAGMIKDLPVIQIPFEEDIAALYRTFSIYVHTPVDPIVEAFGQTYVEALAAGIPSIFTLSGIAAEFIKDNDNALVVDFKNGDGIGQSMIRLTSDESLRERLRKRGKEDVFSRFGIEKMIGLLGQLYDE